ncbi:MAG: hypothetical protein R3E93_05730 [Thiothrix sp.]
MPNKRKPPKKGGRNKAFANRHYTSTSEYKQRLRQKLPILSLYAPCFRLMRQKMAFSDLNDLVNYQRRKAEGGGDG